MGAERRPWDTPVTHIQAQNVQYVLLYKFTHTVCIICQTENLQQNARKQHIYLNQGLNDFFHNSSRVSFPPDIIMHLLSRVCPRLIELGYI